MFAEYIKRYDQTLINDVIPFWMNHAIDDKYGGYFTSLDRDGSVYDTNKYMWMQWRIVYVFTELYLNPLYSKPEFLDIAQQGYEFLYKHGRDENNWYYFALNQQGEPAMAPYSPFSDCFAAMGCALLYKATKEEKYKAAAQQAMDTYVARVNSPKPNGIWDKSLPGKAQYQSLGLYMMLANLGLILDDCLGGNQYAAALDQAVDAVLNKFYQPKFKLAFENVLPDGSLDLANCQGRMLNPGHVLEAMWFLLNALEKQPGKEKQIQQILELIRSELNFGWDKEYGGIYYFMDVLGKPHLELQHDMKLWWVHNEALISSLFAYKVSGDKDFLDWFYKIDEWTWSHFPDPEYGEWFAYLNRRGEPTHLEKGGKWKTFFHLPRCLWMCSRLMREIDGVK